MKPAPFTYVAPRSAEEAIHHLARYGGDARLLAGGQSLIALINLRIARPVALIDLGRCPELAYLKRDGDWLVSGPMTRQITVEHAPIVHECCPLIAKTMRFLGHPTIRNRGTIGGTLAHADRVAELPGVAVALGAVLVAEGPAGRRQIAAEDFFLGDLTTALRTDEMLREIRLPVARAGNRCAFVEASNRHHDLATVGIAATLDLGADGVCTRTRLAAVGIAAAPVRLRQSEARLDGHPIGAEAIREAAQCASEVSVDADIHAGAYYRRRVLVGLVERALQQALEYREGTG
jgi:aerobic carbon-monoxide dehydrogenase medium subunit